MPELHFESSLSMKEIENNFKDVNVFSGIMEGLSEALSHAKAAKDNKQATFSSKEVNWGRPKGEEVW